MVAVEKKHIVSSPDILGGKPRIEGTRIAVMHIVLAYVHQQMTPEEIVEQYPGVSLSDVFAALAFYYDHQEEMDAEIKKELQAADQQHAENISKTSGLRKRLKSSNRKTDLLT